MNYSRNFLPSPLSTRVLGRGEAVMKKVVKLEEAGDEVRRLKSMAMSGMKVC